MVISPLRQWLDSYAKTRLKMWQRRSSILFICNTFCRTFCCRLILLSSLYIELALVCCTNPDNVHCFGTIFLNLNFVFASESICAARPVPYHIFNPTNTEVAQLSIKNATTRRRHSSRWGATKNSAVARNNMMSMYTRGVRGRMKAKQRWFKVTRELCHEWFHHFRHHVHDGHWTGEFATVIWRLHCFTVSFCGDVRGESGPR